MSVRSRLDADRVPRADPRRGAPGVPYADTPRCRDRVVSTDQATPACVARPPRHAGMVAPTSRACVRAVAGYLQRIKLPRTSQTEPSFSSPETHFDKGPRFD